MMIAAHPDTPPTDPFFVPAGPSNTVRMIRHTYDVMEVVAYGLWGQVCRHRMYTCGTNRKQWAIQQAGMWAEQLELYLEPAIIT